MRITSTVIGLAILTLYAGLSMSYARVWENEATAWARAAALAPLKPRPQINYALALMERRRFAEADARLSYAWSLTERGSLSSEDRQTARRAVMQNRVALARLMETAQ